MEDVSHSFKWVLKSILVGSLDVIDCIIKHMAYTGFLPACALYFFLRGETTCSFILGVGDACSTDKQDEHYSLQPLRVSKASADTTGLRRIACQRMSQTNNCRLHCCFAILRVAVFILKCVILGYTIANMQFCLKDKSFGILDFSLVNE